MQQFAADFSWARPDPDAVRRAGYAGVIGYVGHDRTGKLLQKAWFDRYVAAGVTVGLVWELGEQRALAGYGAGVADAQAAIAQADALGYAPGCCIYYVLEDPRPLPSYQYPPVLEYARGVRDVGGPYEQGGYGSQALIELARRSGLIKKGWQVGGWSQSISDVCNLVQKLRHDLPNIEGSSSGDYDENFCITADWGQHPRIDQPKPEEDDDMQTLYLIKGDEEDSWWLTPDFMDRRWVQSQDAATRYGYACTSAGGKFSSGPGDAGGVTPIVMPQEAVNEIPIMAGSAVPPGAKAVKATGTRATRR